MGVTPYGLAYILLRPRRNSPPPGGHELHNLIMMVGGLPGGGCIFGLDSLGHDLVNHVAIIEHFCPNPSDGIEMVPWPWVAGIATHPSLWSG